MARTEQLRLSPKATPRELERAYGQGLLRPDQLEHGAYYRGQCRVVEVARWHAHSRRFVYQRDMRGTKHLDELGHPDGGRTHDIFMPLERVEPAARQVLPDELFERHA